MSLSQHDQHVLALLAWYREMGVEDVLDSVPVDWLDGQARTPGVEVMGRIASSSFGGSVGPAAAVPAASASVRGGVVGGAQAQHGRPDRSFQTPPPDASLAAASDAVRSAPTLSALHDKLLAFEGCALKASAKNTCFYRGASRARVMVIGEAPGRDEDIEGRPFVGRAGQLLDLMLKAIDLGEDSVHITNVVYWRPPGNRTPTAQEVRVCRPFLEQQVRLVEPEFVVLLGGAAAKNLLDTAQGIMRLRGKWRELELGGGTRKVMATLHPAYLLRTPAAKRLAWRDFLAVKAALVG